MEKIITKLNSLFEELEELKQKHHSNGEKRLYEIHALLERVINRIYPEKDSKKIISGMYSCCGLATDDDSYHQKEFIESIERSQKTIKIIKEEYELFGFDDFKPIKEKTETEVKLKTGFLSASRKKIKEDK
jgi:hypothetical protein